MRLMLVGVAIEGGGAEQVINDLALGITRAGHQVLVAFLEGTDRRVPGLEAAGVRCVRLLERRAFASTPWADFTPSCILKLGRLIRDFHPDLVHSHLPRPTLWASCAKRLLRRPLPLVYTEHSVQTVYPRWARSVFWAYLPVTDHVVGVSEAATCAFRKRWRWPEQRLSTIHNGIDLSRMIPTRDRASVRRDLGCPADVPVICNVAKLSHAKAQEVLIAAMARVRGQVPEAHCWIVGGESVDPAHARVVRQALAADHAESFVHLLGERQDVPDLLAASDLFALSSRQEGFPVTILEAMAAGKPVVVTDVGGCAEAVTPGRSGSVVPPEDPDRLAAALVELLRRPEESRRMGCAGRQRVAELFTVQSMVHRHLDLYQRIITPGAAGSHRPARGGRPGDTR